MATANGGPLAAPQSAGNLWRLSGATDDAAAGPGPVSKCRARARGRLRDHQPDPGDRECVDRLDPSLRDRGVGAGHRGDRVGQPGAEIGAATEPGYRGDHSVGDRRGALDGELPLTTSSELWGHHALNRPTRTRQAI